MKILLLTHLLPHPKLTTNRARAFNWLKYLSRNHQVSLVSFINSAQEREQLAALREYCHEVVTVLREPKNRFFSRIINLFQHTPYFVIKEYNSLKMAKEVSAMLRKDAFDLIHVYSLAMAHYVANTKGVIKILDAGDFFTRNYYQQWHSPINLGRRILSFIDWVKMKQYEPAIFSKFEKCILVNHNDKEFIMSSNPKFPIEIITYGVDLEYFKPQSEKEEFPSLIFTGSMDYVPNADAMLYFCRQILPLVEQRYPQIRLYILGRGVSYELKRLAAMKDNIILTGFKNDIREFVAKANIFICPLRIGTGIKTKLLEAMAMGKAIISTSIGIEGIKVVVNKDVMVADSPQDFADTIISLLANKSLRTAMGKNVRIAAEKDHDYKLLTSKLEDIYLELTEKT